VIKSYVEYFLKKINYHFEIKKVHSTKIWEENYQKNWRPSETREGMEDKK
jgi:hypothetical protein